MKKLTPYKKTQLNKRKKENYTLQKFLDNNLYGIYLVCFRQGIPGTRDDPVANGRFFEAQNTEDALNKFIYWANKRKITTCDVYALYIPDVINRQRNELKKGYLGIEEL